MSGPATDAVLKTYADRPHTEIKLDGMRKIIASRLTEAKQTVPHFYLRRDINLDALLAFRSQLNKQLAPRDIKLSVNDFIIKACALALQQVPDPSSTTAVRSLPRLRFWQAHQRRFSSAALLSEQRIPLQSGCNGQW